MHSYFWLIPSSVWQAQIHLLGNVCTWASANIAAVVYTCLSLWYLIRRRRKIYDIPEGLIPLGVSLSLLCFNGPKAMVLFCCCLLDYFSTFSCSLTLTFLLVAHRDFGHCCVTVAS